MSNEFNASIICCAYCGEDKGIVMNTRLNQDAEAVKELHNTVIDLEPCSKCAERIKNGEIFVFEIKTSELTAKHITLWEAFKARTGRMFIVHKDMIDETRLTEPMRDLMNEQGCILLDEETFNVATSIG